MNRKKLSVLILLIITMIACSSQPNTLEDKNNTEVEMTKINNPTSFNQDISNQAKEYVSKDKNITNVYAVNTEKKLVVAIEIPHMKRFQLQKIEDKSKKKIKEEFPEMDINFSTDKKIIIELEQLEQKLKTNSLTKKEMDKKIKKIISLMNEKT
ncbi:YhcN/YlaJ family sporulation lipoprotein [Virgibacillus sp. MSJ-26]|uniref:YhcN/YlaJ family sporulation lipoprotein n=1 Tax=Virgibacillus sp. MSJ-26 TaxID=2841522 RepID=UPI001C103A81|nr:YhcN/YlaJ family sporulation lipoprotein [Virgibacillus sp. MSJ-26]MBU5467112.1 YhcN/YlaJ family sporulation lipoprotein [Virgibacillus sp. MSJ-26]